MDYGPGAARRGGGQSERNARGSPPAEPRGNSGAASLGCGCLRVVAPHFGVEGAVPLAGSLVLAAGAGVLPDWDHPDTRPSRRFGVLSRVVSKATAKSAGGHRKAAHGFFLRGGGWGCCRRLRSSGWVRRRGGRPGWVCSRGFFGFELHRPMHCLQPPAPLPRRGQDLPEVQVVGDLLVGHSRLLQRIISRGGAIRHTDGAA